MQVTWTAIATQGHTMKMEYNLPPGVQLRGRDALSNVCAQNAVPGQPNATCAFQVRATCTLVAGTGILGASPHVTWL